MPGGAVDQPFAVVQLDPVVDVPPQTGRPSRPLGSVTRFLLTAEPEPDSRLVAVPGGLYDLELVVVGRLVRAVPLPLIGEDLCCEVGGQQAHRPVVVGGVDRRVVLVQ